MKSIVGHHHVSQLMIDSKATCQRVTSRGQPCKRSVAAGHQFCWQHASGLKTKVQSLTRNQALMFVLTVVGIVLTTVGVLVGIYPLIMPTKASKTVHVQSSGDQSLNVIDNQGKVTFDNGDQNSGKDQGGKKPTKSDGKKQ